MISIPPGSSLRPTHLETIVQRCGWPNKCLEQRSNVYAFWTTTLFDPSSDLVGCINLPFCCYGSALAAAPTLVYSLGLALDPDRMCSMTTDVASRRELCGSLYLPSGLEFSSRLSTHRFCRTGVNTPRMSMIVQKQVPLAVCQPDGAYTVPDDLILCSGPAPCSILNYE
jgi:hypothetical protein